MKHFHKDLKRGQIGQKQFLALFNKLQETDGKHGDFLAPNGDKIELKSDYYSLAKTQNFFIERYSSMDVLSPGGPWQAAAHGCDWFVYYYAPDNVGFVFYVPDLVKQVEAIESKLTPVEIRNIRWTTLGYKVPRASLSCAIKFGPTGVQVLDEKYRGLIEEWGYVNLEELYDVDEVKDLYLQAAKKRGW